MVNLKAEEKIRLVARLLPPNFKQPNFEKGVYAFLGHREKKSDGTQIITPDTAISSDKDNMYNKVAQHGIAFESGPIAYRIYFNKKQTIDIYAKPTPRLELPITGWYPTADQLKKGFGDDVLLVGNSVGVGTFKGWNGKEATHVEKMSRRTQRIVTTGSLRNIIEIELRDYLIDRVLKEVPYTRLNGHRTDRLPNNANFSFQFIEGESLLIMLDMEGICASSGSACTSGSLDPSHVLMAIGLPHELAHGSLRLSIGDFTTEEDIDYIIEKLPPVIERLRMMSPLYDAVLKQK